ARRRGYPGESARILRWPEGGGMESEGASAPRMVAARPGSGSEAAPDGWEGVRAITRASRSRTVREGRLRTLAASKRVAETPREGRARRELAPSRSRDHRRERCPPPLRSLVRTLLRRGA